MVGADAYQFELSTGKYISILSMSRIVKKFGPWHIFGRRFFLVRV